MIPNMTGMVVKPGAEKCDLIDPVHHQKGVFTPHLVGKYGEDS